MYEDFSSFIKAKGFRTLEIVLDKPSGTIRSYSSVNLIPRAHWPDLMLAYPELGLQSLLDMERAAKSRTAA
jgi:hypothetical protein